MPGGVVCVARFLEVDIMPRQIRSLLLAAGFGTCLLAASLHAADDAADFQPLFDGSSLDGWDGDSRFWTIEDGAITGRTTAENPTQGNTFLIWRGGQVEDFDLRLKFRIEGGNSGIQYRSREVGNWVIAGYQADFDAAGQWTGILYDERGRGILAKRGEKVVLPETGDPEVVGRTETEQKIMQSIRKGEWNDYRIVARGSRLRHFVNGLMTVDVVDKNTEHARARGLVALQLHAGPPMTVQFKEIRLRALEPKTAGGAKKRIVFLAGKPSHGYGAHEHYAGCMILARALRAGVRGVKTEVHRNGWPEDSAVFSRADAIVFYCDGGSGHPVLEHLDEVDSLMKDSVGMVCLHYAVEVPAGPGGEAFLRWIGGYFEANWSVNPFWTARFAQLPDHPIVRGVRPFEIEDEWYYHMRFPAGMAGVTPILTDLPPDSTLRRPDGPHSGNPHVRRSIAAGEPQHVAWAVERPDGGRGFGFTGGHHHWNWGNDDFRTLVLNAILWTARMEVPPEGVPVRPLSVEELEANQDYPQPADFDRSQIEAKLTPSGS
jgi:hypothetical protein